MHAAKSQSINPLNRSLGNNSSQVSYDSQGRPIKKSSGKDSLKHRNPLEDSITISYKFWDSTRVRKLDSSINDFYTRFPVPYTYVDLGNLGTPAHSLFFNPNMKPGWDAGFHSLDVYRFRIEDTKFFTTSRPYTELTYLLGSKSEQLVNILHTQNRKSGLNFTFEYRFINSPGSFKNQKASHNNIRVNLGYQSKNKRYGVNFIYLSNNLKTSENGGMKADSALNNLAFGDPFEVNTVLANSSSTRIDPFNTNITTGTSYQENTLLFRHYYDLGQKDSLVTDSTTIKLFYPRLRLQHTFRYTGYQYSYKDANPVDSDYLKYYNYIVTADTILYKDSWRDITNDFSIISYPQKNNLSQFLKIGAGLQLLKGTLTPYTKSYTNIYVAGEYRNRSRNQKWDIEAAGQFYVTGSYSADYSAIISLKRMLSKKLGYLEIGFQNVNRSPSSVYNPYSAFPTLGDSSHKKENITKLFASIEVPYIHLKLTGEYFLVTNYLYFKDFLTSGQEPGLFNVLHIGAEKKISLSKHWNLYAELHLQQKTGNPPVNLPALFTRDRIAYEGNFYKNLFLSTGLEFRYYSNYKPSGYSPLTGQFFYQDSYTISNRPDISFFFNFRIKSFKGFFRLDNLNTFDKGTSGFGFSKHNFVAPHYASQGLWLRFGVWWSFVN